MTRKVIFPDPEIWTRKDHDMDQPAAVERPLTDPERQLLVDLTVWSVAEQTRATDEAARGALEDINRTIGLKMHGDNHDVYVTTGNGHTLLHCTREWLAFHAHSSEQLTSEDLRRHLNYYKEGDR